MDEATYKDLESVSGYLDRGIGSMHPRGPLTFRELTERLLPHYGNHQVRVFSWLTDYVDISDVQGPKWAPTGSTELEFRLDVRFPEPNPPVDQSGDYESTPDLTALFDGGPE